MIVMMDTNICSSLIRKKDIKRIHWALSHRPGELGISVIVLCELEYGVAHSSDPTRNALALMQFLAPIEIANYESGIGVVYGRIRHELRNMPIGPMDMLIAAHALYLGVELATDNHKEFRRVNGLKLAKIP